MTLTNSNMLQPSVRVQLPSARLSAFREAGNLDGKSGPAQTLNLLGDPGVGNNAIED